MSAAIDAVYVTYHPDPDLLQRSLRSLCGQVRSIHLIDNTETAGEASPVAQVAAKFPSLTLVQLGHNAGIAHAQNLGLERAVAAGAGFTLLSDQDTLYPADYVARMLGNFAAQAEPERIAALAPDFRESNKDDGTEGFFELRMGRAVQLPAGGDCQEVPQAIASGLVIQNSALARVGPMDEALFIDWVDFEWCWRARARGLRLLGCRNVVIDHTLGDSAVAVGGRKYAIHSARREYYIVRNGIAIALRYRELPSALRFNVLLKALRYILAFSLFGRSRLESLRHCLLGLGHGLLGRKGPLSGRSGRDEVAARPPISVCLASYNGERFILAQVRSILEQLGADDELVISDDRSTDRTLELLAGLRDPRIRIFSNQLDKGYSGNFEHAIRQARGEFIFLSDQDDVWLPGKVEKMSAALGQAGLVVSDARFVDEDLLPTGETFFALRGGQQGFFVNLLKSRYLGACMAFRSSLLPRLLPFPRRRDLCPHDLWITLIGEFYSPVTTLAEPLIDYRRHGGNVSTGGSGSSNSLLRMLQFRCYCFLQVLGRLKPRA